MRFALPLLLVALSGCVSTAVAVVTAPIKIVGAGINAGVDAATTSDAGVLTRSIPISSGLNRAKRISWREATGS